jgi:glucosamine-6-phosphate deaminase
MASSTFFVRHFLSGSAQVEVYASANSAGQAAAVQAALLIRRAIADRGRARIIVATGNSQIPVVTALVTENIDWKAVEVFHMDEYIRMKDDHPSSFRYWIRNRLEAIAHPGATQYIEGDAPDLEAEVARYAGLLNAGPIDIAFVGFGENGHIAFNDPPVADFNDPATLKVITLDDLCRKQQAGEGHFPDVESVPKEALTITCPGLFRAKSWICCVPEKRKARAVRDALEGPVSEACPASLVRRHPDAYIFLDTESASELSHIEGER